MQRSALLVGVLPLLMGMSPVMAAAAFADTQDPQMTGTVQAPAVMPGDVLPRNNEQPLFTLGDVPVRVWAPVQPSYDTAANRNGAANPLWLDDQSR